MQTDLNELQIAAKDVDELIGLDVSDGLAIAVYRAIALHNRKEWISVILTEVFVCGLTLIFILSISLVVLNQTGRLHPDTINQTVLLQFGVCFLLIVVWNVYLWRHAKQLKSLARLIHEIDRFNAVLEMMLWIDPANYPDSHQEAIAALHITRESLITALKVEKMRKQRQQFIPNYHDAIASLEHHLTSLMASSVNHCDDDYGPVLDEVLNISTAIYREITRLR